MAKSYVVKTGGATHKFSSAAKAQAFQAARATPVLAGGGGGGSPAPAPTVSRPGQYQVRTPAGDIFSFQTQAEAQAFQARRTDIGATSLTTRAGVPIPKEPMVTITAVSTPEMRSGAPERDIIKGQVKTTKSKGRTPFGERVYGQLEKYGVVGRDEDIQQERIPVYKSPYRATADDVKFMAQLGASHARAGKRDVISGPGIITLPEREEIAKERTAFDIELLSSMQVKQAEQRVIT